MPTTSQALRQQGRCPWCKEEVTSSQAKSHKEACEYRKPAPTVTGLDKIPGNIRKKKTY